MNAAQSYWMFVPRTITRHIGWAVIAILAMLLIDGDTLALSSVQKASSKYGYDLVGWHISNSLSKWAHRLVMEIPGQAVSDADRLALVEEYFRLGRVEKDLKGRLDAVVSADGAIGQEANRLQSELEQTRRMRFDMRNDVEEALESEISSVVRVEGMGLAGEAVFPPVDIRMVETPKALITSPRDRIERLEDALLDPRMSVDDREEVEARLFESENVSALVIDVGGVATYPASVYTGGDLKATLTIMAHEWLHHYLFLRPLGWNMFDSSDMRVLNETVADLGGRELGVAAFERMEERMEEVVPVGLGGTVAVSEGAAGFAAGFDFRREMQRTRRVADALLSRGEVEMAESYMEFRRKMFVENGHPIRKLNQAYFAFNGTYAESAASVNPIGGQVRRLRELSANFGEFISLVSGVSDYGEFVELLEDVEGVERRESDSGRDSPS